MNILRLSAVGAAVLLSCGLAGAAPAPASPSPATAENATILAQYDYRDRYDDDRRYDRDRRYRHGDRFNNRRCYNTVQHRWRYGRCLRITSRVCRTRWGGTEVVRRWVVPTSRRYCRYY